MFQWDAPQSRPQEIDAMAWISLDAPSAYKLGHRQSRVCRSERVAGEQLQRCTCILSVDTPPEHDSVVGMLRCRREWGIEFDGGRRISKGREDEIGWENGSSMAREEEVWIWARNLWNEEQRINNKEENKYFAKYIIRKRKTSSSKNNKVVTNFWRKKSYFHSF